MIKGLIVILGFLYLFFLICYEVQAEVKRAVRCKPKKHLGSD